MGVGTKLTVVVLTFEISSSCGNNIKYRGFRGFGCCVLAAIFSWRVCQFDLFVFCLSTRSPGLQRTWELRACGQNVVYSTSGPAAWEKWKVAISPALWLSWHHWGALEQDSLTPSYRHTRWLYICNKRPLNKNIFKIMESINETTVVLDGEVVDLTLMIQLGSDCCEDRNCSVCPDRRGRGRLTWKRL